MYKLFSDVERGERFIHMGYHFEKVCAKKAKAANTFNNMVFYVPENSKVKIIS